MSIFESFLKAIMKALESFTKKHPNIANNHVKASIDTDTNNSNSGTSDNNNTKVVQENDIEEDSHEALKMKELKEIFKNSIDALNSENVEAYISTLHEGADYELDLTSEYLEEVFKQYDPRLEIAEFKVEEVDKDLARDRVDIITRKISGPEFLDNKT
jgi:hypothetical protein